MIFLFVVILPVASFSFDISRSSFFVAARWLMVIGIRRWCVAPSSRLPLLLLDTTDHRLLITAHCSLITDYYPLFPLLLPCGNRHNRSPLFVASLCEREDEHKERKYILGQDIPVVDPKPVIPERNGNEYIAGLFSRAVNPNERSNGSTVRGLLSKCWSDTFVGHMLFGYFDG